MLTYLSPKEVLVNQATLLKGTFDPQQVAAVALVAEDKYAFNVTLNNSAGTWQVNLDKGFTTPGFRWLRLKGTNSAGKTIANQIIYITVSAKPMTSGEAVSLKILQDTFFKVLPVNSATLNDQQQVKIAGGQTFKVNRYASVDGSLKVELKTAIAPVGNFGYFSDKHVQLIKQSQMQPFNIATTPAPPPGCLPLAIATTTKIKTKPVDTAELAPHEQVELVKGQTFFITGYTCIQGHFRVTLLQDIPDFGKTGYIQAQHVQIKKDDKEVPFDPNALNLTVLNTTELKKQPVDPANLKDEEKFTLPAGTIYGVASYAMQDSNLKVSLTENLPKFGNTGYISPDVVQLSRGNTIVNISPTLTYTGPKEVLANSATTLSGTFDPKQMADVAVVAEDKYPLTVTLDRTAGTWQVQMPNGFTAAGARWLRLKGSDSNGEVTGSQLISITVGSNPKTVGQELTLKVMKDTFFKVSPVDSTSLNQQQKVTLKAGQTFSVRQYGFVDGHLKVTIATPVAPVGDFGYVYEGHVELSKGNQVLKFNIEAIPDTPLSAVMLVTAPTFIKAKPEDSSSLAENQKAQLLLGQNFGITGYACIAGHFRLTLAESIPGFGKVGYIYWRHVQIKKEGKVVPYDPGALTATVVQSTVFKKKLLDASLLSATEKVTLPVGRVYGIHSYSIESGHLKASLTEQLPQFGNTGYLYPKHLQMRRGGRIFDPLPNQVELNVPYFSQRDNPRFYWSTCNVTSIAMTFYYHGIRSQWGGQLEDELLEWCLNYGGEGSQTNHEVLSALIRAYGFKHSFNRTGTWSDVKTELVNRRPVVIAGYFTASGHIISVIGYTPQGYIVNDPWGDALSGYYDTEGARLLYPSGYMEEVCGSDGDVWFHTISP